MNKKHIGSSLESFLEETGELAAVRTMAAKKYVLLVQYEHTKKAMRDLVLMVERARDRAPLQTTEKAMSQLLTKMAAYQRRALKEMEGKLKAG